MYIPGHMGSWMSGLLNVTFMEIWDIGQCKVTTNLGKNMFLQNVFFFLLRNSNCMNTCTGDTGEWVILTIKFSFGIYRYPEGYRNVFTVIVNSKISVRTHFQSKHGNQGKIWNFTMQTHFQEHVTSVTCGPAIYKI
jgi:hypothetical protein